MQIEPVLIVFISQMNNLFGFSVHSRIAMKENRFFFRMACEEYLSSDVIQIMKVIQALGFLLFLNNKSYKISI